MLIDGQRIPVPENIEHLKPYVAGKTIVEVAEAHNPSRISKLASNENRLGCSPLVRDAVLKALDNVQDYPDPVSRRLSRKLSSKWNVPLENILVAGGSESIITILCRTFFRENDEIITAAVTFVKIFVEAVIQKIPLKKVALTDDYRFDLPSIAGAVSDHTKMIYIANPNNPTGTYVTSTEFKEFMNAVPENVLVVMDEAYNEFAVDVEDYPRALTYDYDNLIVLRTFSKAYGLAGLRIGYAIASKDLISEMMKTKLVFEPSSPAQEAASAALDDEDFLEQTRVMVKKNRDRLYNFFDANRVGYVKSVSNAVLMILPSEAAATQFCEEMLKKGVILRRTDGFGLSNCVRITIGTDDEMDHFEESFKAIYPGILDS